ncbi:MAG: ferredoxin [Oscillospiraceae bacterium]|nr:ferredoxin [Oscillospiraceae bacterium]
MLYTSKSAEQAAILSVAQKMCTAIRTAPKTQGKDYIDCCIATGKEIAALARKMEEIGTEYEKAFILRDAGNLRASQAVILVGVKNVYHGLDAVCRYCGFDGCRACGDQGGECVYGPIDLGIAIGSAVALASDHHIDNRVMFSVGRAALDLGYLPEGYGCILGIPLSISGKSPYFDRKKST